MNVNKRLVMGFVLLVAAIAMLCVATASMASYEVQNANKSVQGSTYQVQKATSSVQGSDFQVQGSQYKVQ